MSHFPGHSELRGVPSIMTASPKDNREHGGGGGGGGGGNTKELTVKKLGKDLH